MVTGRSRPRRRSTWETPRPSQSLSFVAGDFSGDGRTDLAVAGTVRFSSDQWRGGGAAGPG